MKLKFINTVVLLCMAVMNGFPAFNNIPKGITVHIDDTGWKRPERLLGPGATYIPVFSDYQTIVNIGKNARTRITSFWCLSDFDRGNICAKPEYSTPNISGDMTQYGTSWDNSSRVSPLDFTIMNYIRDNSAYSEFGLHGVDAVHWVNGSPAYGEWAPMTAGASWGQNYMDLHAKCFLELMRQYYTASESSFPVQFVPPNSGYYYVAGSSMTLGALLRGYGVKYSIYEGVTKTNALTYGNYGIDNGVLVIDIPWQGVAYNAINQLPPDYPQGSSFVVDTHFPNWFGGEAEWTNFLNAANNYSNMYLAKNNLQAVSQWFYREFASVSDTGGTVTINNAGMADAAYTYNWLGPLVLKTPLSAGQHISYASINNNAQIIGYYEDSYRYGYLLIGHKTNTMGRLDKQAYTLTYTLGSSSMTTYMDLTDVTFVPYSFDSTANSMVTKLEMYGTQDIRAKILFTPQGVTSDNPNLTVNSWNYSAPYVTINVTGKNMQGETGALTVSTIPPTPVKILVSANPANLSADNTGTSQVQARVCDAADRLVASSNATITFSRSGSAGGTISATTAQASGGIATITYTAGTSAGTATITATSAGLTQGTVDINLTTPSQSAVTVLSPNGAESWQISTVHTITWTSANMTGNVNIDITTNGGASWISLATNSTNDGTEAIIAPTNVSTACKIRVESASGAPSDTSDNNFSLTSNPQPIVFLDISSLDFGSITQGSSGTNTLNISNSGAGSLTGAITSDRSWVTVTPSSFVIPAQAGIQSVTVTVNTASLAGGANTGNITVTSNGGTAAVNITVNVTIPPGQNPQIALSTSSLNFGELDLGSVSQPQAFNIKNDGQGTLTGTISVSDSWITIDKISLNLAAQAEEQITVSVDNSLLAQKEGPAKGDITIVSNGNDGAQVTTTISVEFTATCVLVKPNPVRLSSPLAGEGRGEGSITFYGDGIVSGQTTIKIYTLSGEFLAVIARSETTKQSQGYGIATPRTSGARNDNEITWVPSNLSPGIYIYVYESPKERGVGKFTVIP